MRRRSSPDVGAPGCSLATSTDLRDRDPGLVGACVRAFARGVEFVRSDPEQAARIAAPYIGISERFISAALARNLPDANALRRSSTWAPSAGETRRSRRSPTSRLQRALATLRVASY